MLYTVFYCNEAFSQKITQGERVYWFLYSKYVSLLVFCNFWN